MVGEGAAGTGTVIRAETVRRYAEEAGFSTCEVLPIENDFWRFYLLRPERGPRVTKGPGHSPADRTAPRVSSAATPHGTLEESPLLDTPPVRPPSGRCP